MSDTVRVATAQEVAAPFSNKARARNSHIRWRDTEYLANAILAALILFAIAPLLLLLALAVYLHDGKAPVFAHRRLGRDGKPFSCLKFRSMAADAETRLAELLECDADARAEWERDYKLRNDPRVTRLGVFLRKSSLDELPQLINVLRGEMSLVGPRPIVDAERAKYGRRFQTYCSVRPGITGLWQISGRNDVSYRRRVAMDVCYARRKSAALDVYILVMTAPCVLFAKGCY
jgi:lipopolysaccharide/colanic/teichoic acid biosynthesis glycosyltransferase